MKAVLISCLFATIFFHHVQSAAVFGNVLGKVFASVSTCTDELQEKISPELCLSQFDADNNPNDAQFDGCKQAMTCAVKKLNFLFHSAISMNCLWFSCSSYNLLRQHLAVMTDEGKWDQTKLSALRDNIRDIKAVEEFDNTMKSCGSVSGTNGEAVVNMISCILNSSEKAKQSYNELKESFMTGYEDTQ